MSINSVRPAGEPEKSDVTGGPLLELSKVTKRFGGLAAVQRVQVVRLTVLRRGVTGDLPLRQALPGAQRAAARACRLLSGYRWHGLDHWR